MKMGNGAVVSTLVVEVVRLHFQNKFFILKNVYFVPRFNRNLISISKLVEQLFGIHLIIIRLLFQKMT